MYKLVRLFSRKIRERDRFYQYTFEEFLEKYLNMYRKYPSEKIWEVFRKVGLVKKEVPTSTGFNIIERKLPTKGVKVKLLYCKGLDLLSLILDFLTDLMLLGYKYYKLRRKGYNVGIVDLLKDSFEELILGLLTSTVPLFVLVEGYPVIYYYYSYPPRTRLRILSNAFTKELLRYAKDGYLILRGDKSLEDVIPRYKYDEYFRRRVEKYVDIHIKRLKKLVEKGEVPSKILLELSSGKVRETDTFERFSEFMKFVTVLWEMVCEDVDSILDVL